MKLNIIVLAKQVPDTRYVDAAKMNADGTINRSALPAIFNPDDLAALELALRLKDENPGSVVSVLTMGPERAADILREALYRGADKGILLCDAVFAGSDTLATSYVISSAVRKLGMFDVVVCGRKTIDGETAQVASQVACMLGIPQLTSVREASLSGDGRVRAVHSVDGGVQTVEASLPLLLSVEGSAVQCRPRNAYRMLRFHRAATAKEQGREGYRYAAEVLKDEALNLLELDAKAIGCDLFRCGLAGSPTKVKNVSGISFKSKDCRHYTSSDEDIEAFVGELSELIQ